MKYPAINLTANRMKEILLLMLVVLFPNLADAGPFIPFATINTYHVTNNNDSGSGSLRDAVSAPNRHIVFDSVEMKITPSTPIHWRENNLWLDGEGTVPTIGGEGIEISSKTTDGKNQLINFKINHIRFRNSSNDADLIGIMYGAQNGLITHCSFSGAADGSSDVTLGAHDIELSYNMYMGRSGPGPILVSFGAYHVSIHHNIFYDVMKRTPSAARRPGGEAWGPLQDPMTDNRYNIVIGPSGDEWGTMSEDSNNNFVYNLYSMGFPIYYYLNDDGNTQGGNTETSHNYWDRNVSIPNCTLINDNWAYIAVNNPGRPAGAWGSTAPAKSWNNKEEWLWSGNASGAVWPDKAGIVAEWQRVKTSAGPDPSADDSIEATARAAISIPDTSIFDKTWNRIVPMINSLK